MTELLSARWVLPMTSEPLADAALVVEGGRIIAVGLAETCRQRFPNATIREFGNAAILPGLINSHSHLELTCFRGRLETSNFFSWISTLVRLKREKLDSQNVLASAQMGCAETIRNGITTTADTADSAVTLEALCRSGLRSVLFQEFFGPDPSQAAGSIEGLRVRLGEHRETITKENAEQRITIGISPHAPYSVSADLYRAAARLAIVESLDVAIHTAESRDEKAMLMDGKGAFADMLRGRGISFTVPETGTIEYFHQLGILETAPLLIHCVSVGERDLEMLAETGARIAHCPKSNAKFGHGVAPYSRMREHRLAVGLGTDSAASNNSLDLFEEARFGSYLHRAVQNDGSILTAHEMLRLVTIDGARALRLEDRVGSLESGKFADIAVVSLDRLGPCHDVESAIAFSAQGADVVFTMVGGEVLFENGRVTSFDEGESRSAVESLVSKLRE